MSFGALYRALALSSAFKRVIARLSASNRVGARWSALNRIKACIALKRSIMARPKSKVLALRDSIQTLRNQIQNVRRFNTKDTGTLHIAAQLIEQEEKNREEAT